VTFEFQHRYIPETPKDQENQYPDGRSPSKLKATWDPNVRFVLHDLEPPVNLEYHAPGRGAGGLHANPGGLR
jgi:hypothetical protein